MNRTKFYRLLLSARENSSDMSKIISEIMPILDTKSLMNDDTHENVNYVDEDLKSNLVEYLIRLVKSQNFANKLAEKM